MTRKESAGVLVSLCAGELGMVCFLPHTDFGSPQSLAVGGEEKHAIALGGNGGKQPLVSSPTKKDSVITLARDSTEKFPLLVLCQELDGVSGPALLTLGGFLPGGCSIPHQIIKEHGGSIDVESTVGQGTRVFARLPLAGPRPQVGTFNGTGPEEAKNGISSPGLRFPAYPLPPHDRKRPRTIGSRREGVPCAQFCRTAHRPLSSYVHPIPGCNMWII